MKSLIDPKTALDLVLERARPRRVGTVPATDAHGLVLAQEVRADRDYPPFDRATMDGFAVCVADAGKQVAVAGLVAAGTDSSLTVSPGVCVEIMTGAACPAATEAVVPYEQAERDGSTVILPPEIRPDRNVARRGAECAAGQVVMCPGDELTDIGIAVLAAFGIGEVEVHPRPSLAVITTGEELAQSGEPGAVQIRDSNGPMLAAMARRLGLDDVRGGSAVDNADSLRKALMEAEDADIIVLCGGVSMGAYDLVPDTVRAFGAEVVFHRVTQKPGKPLLFAERGGQLIFGLPGNPLSAHLGFHRYVTPSIRALCGLPARRIPERGVLSHPARPDGQRTLFRLVRVERTDNGVVLVPLEGKGSADIFSSVSAAGYITLEPGKADISAGAAIEYEQVEGGAWRT
jgi:molybdopterin molybdotransferase